MLRRLFELDDGRDAESVEWLNRLTRWLHEQLADGPLLQRTLDEFFAKVAVDVRRRRWGSLLCESRLEDFCIGDTLPQISHLRLVCGGEGEKDDGDAGLKDQLSRRPQPLLTTTLAAHLCYRGELGGTVYMETIFGVPLWLRATLQRLEGTLYVLVSPDAYHFTFRQIDQLQIVSRVSLAGREWRLLNWIVSNWLLPSRLRRRFLAPGVKSRWLFDAPPPPYYPWDPEVRAQPALLFAERAPA